MKHVETNAVFILYIYVIRQFILVTVGNCWSVEVPCFRHHLNIKRASTSPWHPANSTGSPDYITMSPVFLIKLETRDTQNQQVPYQMEDPEIDKPCFSLVILGFDLVLLVGRWFGAKTGAKCRGHGYFSSYKPAQVCHPGWTWICVSAIPAIPVIVAIPTGCSIWFVHGVFVLAFCIFANPGFFRYRIDAILDTLQE